MEVIKFNLNKPNIKTVKNAAEVIKKGGVIIFPTDTVYGIAADATNAKAIEKLFLIKKRDAGKPVSIIIKDIKTARRYTAVSAKVEKVLNKLFPGPFTIVLRKKEKLPEALTAGMDTIGLRIPDCSFTKLLSEELDVPYTATSANISGEPSTNKSELIKKVIFSKNEILPDLIVDAGDLPQSEASAVIDLTTENPKILRTGPMSRDKLLKLLSSFG